MILKSAKKCFLVQALLATVVVSIGCSQGKDRKEKDNRASGAAADTSGLPMSNQAGFKKWLADTLPVLHKTGQMATVTDDSMGLNLEIPAHAIIRTNAASRMPDQPAQLKSLLLLLKEYDEYPTADFEISCRVQNFYAASPVPGLTYDLTSTLDSIVVRPVKGNWSTSYTYIRGRLSGKITTRELPNGKEETTRTDFIWENEKLVKRPV